MTGVKNLRHEIHAILTDIVVDGARQWLDNLFPPSTTYRCALHPIWNRGSLTTHMPMYGGEPSYRIAHQRTDGVWVENARQHAYEHGGMVMVWNPIKVGSES